ncbi:WAT1-related protein At4g08290-like [Trifolium pratense]|uniref:WAT1-related protein At4g08290-like n=1 Tax=Trifolium pratense TaxID=57577 RepID=UPI001E692D5A|nr:WAT1-related protein At4g08290-like [Trifolium pratense]
MGAWLRNAKPYLLLLAVQFGSAGMFIFAMDAIKKGMSHYVFIVYRNAIAAVTLAPFAFHLERKIRPKMSVRVFSEIMALAFFEIILDQCFALLGMKLTSASFLSAVMNSAPSITFVLAVILKLEHMKIKERACQAKIIGTVVTFGGTLLMALYKGPVVSVVRSSISHVTRQPVNDSTGGNDRWIIGTCFLLIGCAGFSAFYILQAITLRKYPAPMSLATWVCFVGAIQSFVVAFFAERHNSHAWYLGWDTRLFAPAYAGIVTSGVQYYIQGMVIKSMGPVIVTAFNPVRMIIVTALACIILSEQLFLGSIIGAIVVVLGLYLVVWGKSKEYKARNNMQQSRTKESTLQDQQQLPVTAPPKNESSDNKAQIVIHNEEKCHGCDQN